MTRDTKDLIKAFTGGVLIFYIGSSLAKLADSAGNLIFDVSQATVFVGNAILFAIAVLIGLVGGPLLIVFVLNQKRTSYLMASAIGLLNLSISFSLSEDISSGVLTLGVVVLAAFVLRYSIEGLALTASTLDEPVDPTEISLLIAIAIIPAIAGYFLATPTTTSFADPFILSIAAGLFTYLVPRFIFDPSYERNRFRFLILIAGMSLTAIVELTSTLIGR